jgi:D-alanyl-D-alanine carboxypeptidase
MTQNKNSPPRGAFAPLITRREALALGVGSAAAVVLPFGRPSAAKAPATSLGRGARAAALAGLDRFIAGYCEAMNAPGLTLGLADRDGPIRVCAYGYTNLEARVPVSTLDLFEIGSISKSFVALTLLQLHDEGKLDLRAPIRHYLPWLAMESDYGEILVHHLLTHSSGMPEDAPVFPSEPERRPRQAYVPGSQFHYSNWGYGVLGYLVESLDGRPWPIAVTARILRPLGMRNTVPAITSGSRGRIARSYTPLHDDRPYPRHGPLAVAGNLEVEDAAGSIASCPSDMAAYMCMILNGGAHARGRIVSAESFTLFSTPYIAAPDFGPTASYGYGIAVDELDGHRRLRHTGGMVSFMSALHLDLEAGFAAFASINAQLGYRPNPVVQQALRVLRSAQDKSPAPPMPPFDESAEVPDAASYQGSYLSPDGRRLEVVAASGRLVLERAHERIALQHVEADTFIADHADLALYPLVFERDADAASPSNADASHSNADASHSNADASPSNAGASRQVVALGHGPDWYARPEGHARPIEPAPELARYEGAYYSADPWAGWVRVVQRQGRLWIGGTDPLSPIGDRLFRVGRPTSPEVAEFVAFVDGSPRRLRFGGGEFERIEAA